MASHRNSIEFPHRLGRHTSPEPGWQGKAWRAARIGFRRRFAPQ